MSKTVVRFNDYKEIAKELTVRFQKEIDTKGSVSIAVSGGSTPLKIFKEWANSSDCDWSKVKIFWVDERVVPVESPENNFGNAKRIFSQNENFPLQILYPMLTEGENLSEEYSKTLTQESALPLDIILLGIGDDGHTASIFPGQNHLFKTGKNVVDSINPYSKQQRITLSGETIYDSASAIFIATGEGKRKILPEIISPDFTEQYPACQVYHNHSNVEIFTDIDIS